MMEALKQLALHEGACIRCVKRFQGETSLSAYTYLPDISLTSPLTPEPCTLCLGILNPEVTTLLSRSQSIIKQADYEFCSYKFTVCLPATVYLRQAWFKGKCKLNGIDLGTVVDIKEVFKWVFSPMLADVLGVHFSNDAEFFLNFEFKCEAGDKEIEMLENQIPDLRKTDFRKHKKRKLETFSVAALLKGLENLSSERIAGVFSSLKPYDYTASIVCSHSPVYVAGNYLKLSRELSQSPWGVDSDPNVQSSVQDRIGEYLKPAFSCKEYILHASVKFI